MLDLSFEVTRKKRSQCGDGAADHTDAEFQSTDVESVCGVIEALDEYVRGP